MIFQHQYVLLGIYRYALTVFYIIVYGHFVEEKDRYVGTQTVLSCSETNYGLPSSVVFERIEDRSNAEKTIEVKE